MENKVIKDIHIQVPEREYRTFKIFAFSNGITLQRFLRSAAHYYMKEVEKEKFK